jgi:hypothetical protein
MGRNRSVIQWYSNTVIQWYGDTVIQWYSNTVIQWYGDTVIRWYSDTVIRWYSDMVIQWYGDSDMVIQWYGDTVIWWYSDRVIRWYSDTMIQWLSQTEQSVLISVRVKEFLSLARSDRFWIPRSSISMNLGDNTAGAWLWHFHTVRRLRIREVKLHTSQFACTFMLLKLRALARRISDDALVTTHSCIWEGARRETNCSPSAREDRPTALTAGRQLYKLKYSRELTSSLWHLLS